MIAGVEAVGEGALGPGKAALAAFIIGLLVTFLFVRINTRLIRARVSWWFHDIESGGGLHVHHMVIGVVLMVVAGLGLIAWLPQGLELQLLALAFGAGVALTLDEFALILRLQDVYWTSEGRLSVDAVIVALCAGLLLLIGVSPLGNARAAGESGFTAGVVIAVVVVEDLVFAVICLLKGKLWTGFFGLFIPVVGLVGAVRLARPRSPWARRRYESDPKKLARALHREERLNRTIRAWREAFFDLIAGKPHLPVAGAPAAEAAPRPAPEEPAPEEPASDDAAPDAAERGAAGRQSPEQGQQEEGEEMAGEGGLEPPIP